MSLRSLLGGAAPRRMTNQAPVPYVSRWRAGLESMGLGGGSLTTSQELEQYGQNGTLFGIVSKLATGTSLVKWKLYRQSASGNDEDRSEVPNGRKLAPRMVWERPNPFMSRMRLVETFQQHVDLTGKGYLVVSRAGGIPVELWPVRPDRMYPVPSREDFIAGYVYCGPDGEKVPLQTSDVIPLIWPAPLDLYDGQSALPALSRDLSNDENQAAWSQAFFRNSAAPGGVIEDVGPLSEEQFDELVDRWNRSHRGVNNAGRVAILERGKFVPMAYTQKDMQFVESRGYTKQALLDAYGMPKFGIGDVTDVNRASAEASKAWFAESLLVPRLERIKGALNGMFLPMFGMDHLYEFDYENPIPEDQETENATLTASVNALVALVNAGFDSSEACDVVELPQMAYSRPAPKLTPFAPNAPGQDQQMPNGGEQDGGQPGDGSGDGSQGGEGGSAQRA